MSWLRAAFVAGVLLGCSAETLDPVPPPDEGDGGAPPAIAPRALLLDQELAHHAGWIDVLDGLAAAGFEPSYRRFYPHLTAADVDEHELVILAAGRFPGNPSSRARLDEVAQAKRFVEEGGKLVLVTQAGWQDSYSGENDFFVHNRILEELAVPVRIERSTVIGAIWPSQLNPAHQPSAHGYPTPLEPQLGYPYFIGDGGEQLAGGSAPLLRVASPEVQTLLRTHAAGYVWRTLGGTTEALSAERAVGALARAGAGWVAVVPRGTLALSATTGALSDKPALDPEREQANHAWTHGLLARLHALDARSFTPTVVHEGDALFSVASPAVAPLSADGEVVTIQSEVSILPVAEAPPAGTIETPRTSSGDVARPPWLSAPGRIAYGGLSADVAAMEDAFAEIAAHGVDAVMTSTGPELLAQLEGQALADEEARYAAIAELAEAAGTTWIVGDWINAEAGDYPPLTGAHGGAANHPSLLNDAFWDDTVLPMYGAVGALAAEHPGIAGLHLDLELYSGPIQHHDGWAFSEDDLATYLAGVTDRAWADELAATPAAERLDLLIDRGLLGDYFAALEARAFELGVACREAAHAQDPDLALMVYLAGYPSTWFYRGLLRGMGTAAQPVIVLSYEGWSQRANATLRAEGIHFVHLGGTIVPYWTPADFGAALEALARGNDGYWFYTFNDLSSTNPAPPALHGSASEYWGAIDQANASL